MRHPRITLALLFAFHALSGCGQHTEPEDQNPPPDAAVPDPVGTCQTSAQCTGSFAGQVCTGQLCVACNADSECTLDPVYASTRPHCHGGVCSECPAGDLGCACMTGNTCTQGECVSGTCVDCQRGAIGCVCRANGTCAADAQCGTGGLCVACVPGMNSCPCTATGTCNQGLVCQGSVCVPDPCVAGAVNCPCAAGSTCTVPTTYCDAQNVCQPCSSDVAGCPCDSGGVCQGANYCESSSTTCRACPATGKPLTCDCLSTSECGNGLACDNTSHKCRPGITCEALNCAPNQVCDASSPDAVCAPSCTQGYLWDPVNRVCTEIPAPKTCVDGMGNPTPDGQACLNAGKTCVQVVDNVVCVATCQTLNCEASHRACTPASSPTADAVCGACDPGYVDQAGSCALDPSATCSSLGVGSIAATCAAKFRECLPGAGGMGATCGACLSGHVLDTTRNVCVNDPACGNEQCTSSQFCDFPQDGSPPRCETRCAPGEALDDSTGMCTSCGSLDCGADSIFGRLVNGQCACSANVYCAHHTNGVQPRCQVNPCPAGQATIDGITCSACAISCTTTAVAGRGSRLWPWRTPTGECQCETVNGYFLPYGQNAQPKLCDADNDGWINETAEQVWDVASGTPYDAVALANFRCERREIDRMVLRNEYGQQRELGICSGDLLSWAPGNMPLVCAGFPTVFALHEPDVLDSDNQVTQNATALPAYGGRVFTAAELNPLTKACVSLDGDFNFNGREDLLEIQPLQVSDLTWMPSPTQEALLYAAVSYFTELHTGQFATGPGGIGKYLVTERSRCDDVPLTYEVGRGRYWQGCTRLRNARYVMTGDRTGMDFGAFTCGDAAGPCALPSPDELSTMMNLDGDTVVDHDVCALRAAGLTPIADEPWLGMNHSSQFQCVQVVSAAGANHQLPRDQLRGAGSAPRFDFNTCGLTGSTSQASPLNQPVTPQLACDFQPATTLAVPDDSVGFVSTRFLQDTGPYERGCINESLGTVPGVVAPSLEQGRGWSRLCGGFLGSGFCLGTVCSTSVLTTGNPGDFGKLICSCGTNFSGPNCDVSCSDEGLHVGGGSNNSLTTSERALYACTEADPGTSYYCSLVPPQPGFSGGVMGAWMCGEVTASSPASGTNPVLTGAVGSQNAEWHGNVRTVPFEHTPLTYTTPTGSVFTLY